MRERGEERDKKRGRDRKRLTRTKGNERRGEEKIVSC